MNKNGRIDIMGPPTEQIQQSQNYTDYRDALMGMKEETILSRAFFSKENVEILQNRLRSRVYKMSNNAIYISPQDETTLKMYMREFFIEYGQTVSNNITSQIDFINTKIIDHCSHLVYSEAKAYRNYKKDVSTLSVPHELPTSTRDFQQIQMNKEWF